MGNSSAKPTGTMSAAASAARIRTRYRFRIATNHTSSDVPDRRTHGLFVFHTGSISTARLSERIFTKCVC
jgi:hypothetical protein